MATNAAFRNFLQDPVIGLNAETAREVVDEHGINTMKRLADLTREGVKDLADLIYNQRVLNVASLPRGHSPIKKTVFFAFRKKRVRLSTLQKK